MRALASTVVAAVLLVSLIGALPAAVAAAMVGGAAIGLAAQAPTGGGPTVATGSVSGPSELAQVPTSMLALYQRAARTCPGLPWSVLAAIGTVESSNGTSPLPGVRSGANAAGAEGPMQFEPTTFALYDRPVPAGGVKPPSPYDPVDAVYAAARDLCANGAASGRHLAAAVFAYNHSSLYVSRVLTLAQSYREVSGSGGAAAFAARVALDWALAQVGTPYVWGGEAPGVGFDCSGLVQAAYKVPGITLPRVAQDQFDAGPRLAAGARLVPGDLVFFGGGAGDVSHVGIYVGSTGGQAYMVDAPHTGADVRVEPFPTTVGAPFGAGDVYVGATRPAASFRS